MPDEGIEARAERLAKAREKDRRSKHIHCPTHPEYLLKSENYGCLGCLAADPPVYWYAQPTVNAPICADDHRTPAERTAAALDAAATVWAFAQTMQDPHVVTVLARVAHDAIQRTEGPQ